MGKGNLKVLAILAIVVGAAAVVIYQQEEKRGGEKFTPTRLFDELNIEDIAEIHLTDDENDITLKAKNEDSWGLATRGGYPIDHERAVLCTRAVRLKMAFPVDQWPDQRRSHGTQDRGAGTRRTAALLPACCTFAPKVGKLGFFADSMRREPSSC